jgi:hypothetical protein
MPETFASSAEQSAAKYFAANKCIPCQTFAPHFQTEFIDSEGYKFTALPDFYHAGTNTFFEFKSGLLNSKKSFRTADNKLRSQYRHYIGSDAGLSYSYISSQFWLSKWQNNCLLHAWNHSIAKHLIIQKSLGVRNYVVIFGNVLDEETSKKYTKKGLFHLHISQLSSFLTPASA